MAWERERVGIDRRRSGVGGGVWIGMSGRGGGEQGQTGLVGWEGERVGIDRRKSRWERESGDRSGVGDGEWL